MSFWYQVRCVKIYDRINWKFVKQITFFTIFSNNWINIVCKCITLVSFYVLLNYKYSSPFNSCLGLKQRDPLSPYLILLCVNILADLIVNRIINFTISKLSYKSLKSLIYLFVDDNIIFCAYNLILSKYWVPYQSSL